MTTATEVANRLDGLLGVPTHPDFPGALNGLQLDHHGPVRAVAAAVDVSVQVIEAAAASGANFLVVHHGLFWGGPQRLTSLQYRRLRALFEHDIAVYSAHLPLDSHPDLGNNVLLARRLLLEPDQPFASFQGVQIGVAGRSDLPTAHLQQRLAVFSASQGGTLRTTSFSPERRTKRWAICTGAGASSDSLREAEEAGVDTLIVGEGPHHTAVDAPDRGLVVFYAGHYATETLGVAAVGALVASEAGVPYHFIDAPTGL